MPATYAHYTFGRQCLEILPPNLKQICLNHLDLFFIGVHGPDILFYDLKHKDVTSYGTKMHFRPAKIFFEESKDIYNNSAYKQESLAYLIGFVSHFVLDSSCHFYVDKKVKVENISHNKIESEYDRHLLELEKVNIKKIDRGASLKPNKDNTKIIAQFYPFDEQTIYRTCKNQVLVVKLLKNSCTLKVNLLKTILRKKNMHKYADLYMDLEPYKPCANSNVRLDKYRNRALKIFPEILKNYIAFLNNEAKLDKYFENDFEGYDDGIEVLTYEEELEYKF